MEAHHHGHVHHTSKWKEYLFQFLMLFLAVFCGFLAEYKLEHVIEHNREKEYMRDMVNDLKADTAELSKTTLRLKNNLQTVDTMLMILKTNDPDAKQLCGLISKRFYPFLPYYYNNRTVQQLRNAGSFRLIRNKAISDSILAYDNTMINITINIHQDFKDAMYAYKDVESKVIKYAQLNPIESQTSAMRYFDAGDFDTSGINSFISTNKELLAIYYNKLFMFHSVGNIFIFNLERAKERAVALMKFIQKEYHLKDV